MFCKKSIKANSKQSFLYAKNLFMPTKKVNIKKFKEALINSPSFTEKLFLSLNNGMLAQKFFDKRTSKTPFENYKNFILGNDHDISYEYIWDLVQRPGILLAQGCNILIFTSTSTICPYKEDITDYYDENTTIMLYTNTLYYEPIFS